MSLDMNKAIARRFYEGYNTGDLDSMFALIAPDVVWHGPSGEPLTREQWKQIDATLVLQREVHYDVAVTGRCLGGRPG